MTLIIPDTFWEGSADELATAIDAHRSALEAHRRTTGVPAPLAPAVVEMLAASDREWTLARDVPPPLPPPPPPPPEPPTLEQAQAARRAYIKGRRAIELNVTILTQWNGRTWQARENDRTLLDGAIAKLEDPKLPALLPPGISIPATIPWRDEANVVHALTPDQGRVLSAMMFLAQQAVWMKSWALDEAIQGAKSVAAVDAVDW